MKKSLDKVESEMAKAKQRIDSIGEKTMEQYQNWKKVLSGALNDPQLILSLIILLLFYVLLTAFNAIFGGNSREEDASDCNCDRSHRVYYRSIIIISIVTWGVGFFLIAIWDLFKFRRHIDMARHPEKYQVKKPSSFSETQKYATSFLEKTIDSVEVGAQAALKIPVKSMVTKTLDIVDNEVETLQGEDDENKSLQTNPIDTILTKLTSMQDKTDNVDNDDGDEMVSESMLEPAVSTANSNPATSTMLETSMRIAATNENSDEIEVVKQKCDDLVAINLAEDDIQIAPVEFSRSVHTGSPENILKHSVQSEEPFLPKNKCTSSNSNRKSSTKESQETTLSPADQKTLQRIEHYENFLWLELYKVYSVGATTEDETHILPAFVKILGDANANIGKVVSEAQPLLQSSTYDGTAELPTTVTEPDFSDENYDVEDFGEINDTKDVSAVSNSTNDLATKKTNLSAKHKGTDLNAGTMKDANEKVSGVKHIDDVSMPKPYAENSNTHLDDKDDDNEDKRERKSFHRSWEILKPEGLFTDMDEDNTMWYVADMTCASVGFLLYPFLVAVRLLAQLALVPLLLFQVLGTYPWICVTSHFYCRSNINQYRLGIDKSAVGFSFYFCVLVAVLSTAILRWFPCSKSARSADANCIM